MTGPEHYQEAEKLMTAANRRIIGNASEWLQVPARRAELRAEAQVHATLALAAATATGQPDHPAVDWDAWRPIVSAVAPRKHPQ